MAEAEDREVLVDVEKVKAAIRLREDSRWVRTLSAVALGGSIGTLSIQVVLWVTGVRHSVFWLVLSLLGLAIALGTWRYIHEVDKEIRALIDEAEIKERRP